MDDSMCFDDILFGILKDCKTLPTFLDAIFGFLNRRTDFYIVAKEPNSPVGLPDGLAERLVKHTFYKWKPTNTNKELVIEDVPEVVSETVVETSSIDEITSEISKSSISNKRNECNFTLSEYYNGALYDNYSWSQTLTEVDVMIKVPDNITTKELLVIVLPQKLSVNIKDCDIPILEGNLCQKNKHLDAIWSLDKTKLEIHLEKSLEMWWDCLLENEPKLDISKLDCSRPFEELSDEAQAKIQELTWNQDRKRLGLPTSDELKIHEKLKQGWNAEGSPFSGPFDQNTIVFN